MKTLDEFDSSPAGESLVNLAQLDSDLPGNTANHPAKTNKRRGKPALLFITALSVFGSLGAAAWSVHKPVLVLQGEVQVTEIKVVPKVAGRVQTLHACKGDKVRKGQLLVSLENQELQIKLEQARAALELAKEHNKIVRANYLEHLGAQSNWWVNAKELAEHASQSVDHSRALQTAEVISVQELQVLERDLDRARSAERGAKASFDLAAALFGREGQLVASNYLEQASRTVAELEMLVTELELTSPVDGEVQAWTIRQGEVATAGLPVATIADPQDVCVRFNLPEHLLSNMRVGSTFSVRMPALGNQEVLLKVSNISPNGSFVSRQADEGSGDLNPRTFEVCAVPVKVTQGLRSGMSALFTLRKFN